MQGYLLGIFFILLLVVIDFYLQKKINKKGYVFLCINKGRLRYQYLFYFVAFFIYFVIKKQYLLILCMLYMLRIIDKLIYIDRNNTSEILTFKMVEILSYC